MPAKDKTSRRGISVAIIPELPFLAARISRFSTTRRQVESSVNFPTGRCLGRVPPTARGCMYFGCAVLARGVLCNLALSGGAGALRPMEDVWAGRGDFGHGSRLRFYILSIGGGGGGGWGGDYA